MTAIGTPTMTDAEERAWAEAQRSGTSWAKQRPKAGGLQREDHVWKTKPARANGKASVAARSGRSACVDGGAHRYRIAEPDGRHMLPGACSKCGAERSFVAAEAEWDARESNARSVLTDPRDAQERTTLWEEMRQ